MTDHYRTRISDIVLQRKLKGKGAVLIEGPKWCGKTTSAEQTAGSILYMDDPEKIDQNISLADLNPRELLKGNIPRLIDEWQIAPKLWDAIRFEVDHRDGTGQFILTGSAVPVDDSKIKHSGTGRITRMRMRPMSLFESGNSTGEVHLSELFSAPGMIHGSTSEAWDLDHLAFLTCRGGWPKAVDMEAEIALDQATDYYESVVYTDINRADDVHKDPERVKRLMRSLARHQGAQVSNAGITRDIEASENEKLSEDTVASYILALKKIFVVEDMPAWNPNLRSKTAIRTSDTRYYVDPSVAVAAIGAGPRDLVADLKTFGFFFETMCVRDLRIYAEPLRGKVYHFRDKSGLECDAVIHLRNGDYGLVEIKLGGEKLIEEGAHNLDTLRKKIDEKRMKSPSFMMILVGTGGYAYQRKDGIYVVPVGCLRE